MPPAFLGLRNTHTKADMIRAVMEGITLEARHILESMMSAGVVMDEVITVTGGASKSTAWCQILADIMGRRIRTLGVADAAVLGAAGMAAVGAGLFKDLEECVATMVRFSDVYEPIEANVAAYNKTFQAYKDAYAGLKSTDVFTQLAELRPQA